MTKHETQRRISDPAAIGRTLKPSHEPTTILVPKPVDWDRLFNDPSYSNGPPEYQEIEIRESEPPKPKVQRPSWLPVDPAPYLDGTVKRAEPTMGLARTDGLRLLYPGKEHYVIGETESGKSWFALGCVAAELNAWRFPSESHTSSANRHVLYFHFEESDPTDTFNRLRDVDVYQRDIEENFHFVSLDVPLTETRYSELVWDVGARILNTGNIPVIPPILVIFDGMTEAMALHGWDIRDESGVAAFRRHLIQPFKKAGMATLICDHVVKDRDKRGRTPLGSVHKLNGLDGAAFLLETKDPFGRGKRGAARLFVVKDRPGALRRHGLPDKSIPGKTYMGMQVVDSVTEDEFNPQSYVDLSIIPPSPEETAAEPVDRNQITDDRTMEALRKLRESGSGPFSTRKVRAVAGMDKETVAVSLERLTVAGHVTHSSGPNRAELWDLGQ